MDRSSFLPALAPARPAPSRSAWQILFRKASPRKTSSPSPSPTRQPRKCGRALRICSFAPEFRPTALGFPRSIRSARACFAAKPQAQACLTISRSSTTTTNSPPSNSQCPVSTSATKPSRRAMSSAKSAMPRITANHLRNFVQRPSAPTAAKRPTSSMPTKNSSLRATRSISTTSSCVLQNS